MMNNNPSQWFWSLFLTLFAAAGGSIQDIERHLQLGKQYLSKGQLSDALTQYHSAIELDPDHYQALFQRATAYLAVGKPKAAVTDLNRVIELKPDFSAARAQRANVLLRQGDIDGAEKDYKTIFGEREVEEKLHLIENVRRDLEDADNLIRSNDYFNAQHVLSTLIEIIPWSEKLRFKRADCYERMGDLHKAIMDIRSAVKLVPDNTGALYKASQFAYMLGELADSMEQIRECLKIDPDNGNCFPFYKKLKKLIKQREKVLQSVEKSQWQDCLDGVDQMMKMEKDVEAVVLLAMDSQCQCLTKLGRVDEAIRVCTDILNSYSEDVSALLNRAEAHVLNDAFEDAVRDYQQILNNDENNRAAKEGLKKAQKLLKQSKKKDYYKILGVKRNADKSTILKAYRKLAQKWHPDNFDEKDKKQAESMFIDIAAAKEVLTDPEKRSQFDSGVDPLDPEAQQQAHNPFYHFYQGFDSPFDQEAPFTFKFHFQ